MPRRRRQLLDNVWDRNIPGRTGFHVGDGDGATGPGAMSDSLVPGLMNWDLTLILALAPISIMTLTLTLTRCRG